MLRKGSPFRIYPDDWILWERRIWVWAHRPREGLLVLYCTPPFQKDNHFNRFELERAWHPHHWLEQQGVVMGKYIKQALKRAGGEENPLQLSDAAFKKALPALCEFMTDSTGEDGEKRALSRLTVFFERGFFKVFLNDPDSRQSLCVSSTTFEGLWKALEGSLTSDTPPWRDMPEYGGKKAKRT